MIEVGPNTVASLRGLLHDSGTRVFVGGEGGNRVTGGIGRQIVGVLMSPLLKQNIKMFVSGEKQSMIRRINEFIKSGAVTPATGHQFARNQVPTAMRELVEGNLWAKSIIVVRP